MKPGVSRRVKVFVVIAVILSVGLTSVVRAEDRRWIVIFFEGTDLGAQELLFKRGGIKVVHTLSFINALAIELPLGDTLDNLLAFLLGKPVEGVFDDSIGRLNLLGPLTSQEAPEGETYDWAQVRIGTPVVHQNMPEWQGAGVKIAILDTGIDANHPDLEQNVIQAYNTRAGGGPPGDDNGHGTHIAGIVAAMANDRGLIGVAPQASLVSVKVLDHNGEGYLSDFIEGLELVYNNHIKLINTSLGFATDDEPLKRAIKRLYNSGAIMVASAGNRPSGDGGTDEGGGSEGEGAACDTSTNGGGTDEGGGSEGEGASACSDTVRYPARYREVIAVAATDVYDRITNYSLAGREVDMAAPGGARANERILSTRWGGGYSLASGTSQATAHVTGCLALALQRKPGLSFEEARDLLRRTALELPCCTAEQQGAGLIDVEKMMQRLR